MVASQSLETGHSTSQEVMTYENPLSFPELLSWELGQVPGRSPSSFEEDFLRAFSVYQLWSPQMANGEVGAWTDSMRGSSPALESSVWEALAVS